jgi:NTP pyrophosphatase (non-canonical NTP hydrolase)
MVNRHTPTKNWKEEHMSLGLIQQMAWEIAEAQGQHKGLETLSARDQLLIRCALLHGEVSEIADRAKKQGVSDSRTALAEECADVCILLAELAEQFDIDLETAVMAKMTVNRNRPYGYGTPIALENTSTDADHTCAAHRGTSVP